MSEPSEPKRGPQGFAVWLILVIGILLVIVGIVFQAVVAGEHLSASALSSGLLITLGGGILGAAIENLISHHDELDVLEHIRRTAEDSLNSLSGTGATSLTEITALLRKSLTAAVHSPDDSLEPFRREWHHYHVTRSGRELRWMYSVLRADSTRAVNSLALNLSLRDEHGEDHSYDVEMFTRRDRLFVVYTRHAGTEAASTELFPQPGQYQHVLAGLGQRVTWDRQELVAPVLMSKRPLVPGQEPGMVDRPHHLLLDEAWSSTFPDHNKIHLAQLPGAGQPDSVGDGLAPRHGVIPAAGLVPRPAASDPDAEPSV